MLRVQRFCCCACFIIRAALISAFLCFAPQGEAFLAAPERGGSRTRFFDAAKAFFEVEELSQFCPAADAVQAQWKGLQQGHAPDRLNGYSPDLHHSSLMRLRHISPA